MAQFADRLRGILSGGNPLFDLGIGLLNASGPSLMPHSLGQDFASAASFASNRQLEALRNQEIREKLLEQRRRKQALERLPGILGAPERMPEGEALPPGGGVLATKDQRQGELMGILTQIAPEQMAVGLLNQMFPGQERAEPAPVRIARVLADPNESPEVKKQLQAQISADDRSDELANLVRSLQAEQLGRQLETEQDETNRKRIEAEQSILVGTERIREMAEINNRLRDTAGETGLGFADLRARALGPFSELVGFFGGDQQRARQVAVDVQRLEQITATEALQSLFSGEINAGTLTNQKISTFFTTKPGLTRLPEVNEKIFADMLQTKLDVAKNMGFEIAGRQELEQLVETLRSGRAGSGGTGTDLGASVRNAAGAVSDTAGRAFRGAQSTLNSLIDSASSVGGRAQKASADALSAAKEQVAGLRDMVSPEDIKRAQELIDRGTEESLLAARGLLDRAMEQAERGVQAGSELASQAAEEITRIGKMTKEQLSQLDLQQLSDDALEAARKRWEELNAE